MEPARVLKTTFNVTFMTHMIYNCSSMTRFVSDLFLCEHVAHGGYQYAEYDGQGQNSLGGLASHRKM